MIENSSSTSILMGRYNHPLSLDATIMVSQNCPIIVKHVVIIFVAQKVTIATVWPPKTPLIDHVRYINILNMVPMLSEKTSIFGVTFILSKSLLGIERQKKLQKFAILIRKPGIHVWILIYRTRLIMLKRHRRWNFVVLSTFHKHDNAQLLAKLNKM